MAEDVESIIISGKPSRESNSDLVLISAEEGSSPDVTKYYNSHKKVICPPICFPKLQSMLP
jgi:hypothetical protein